MLFLAYPKSDYDEPEGALASYIEVLSGYSDAIVAHVTSNKTGVQRRSKFPPRVAELVEACEEAAAPMVRQLARERQVAELLAEREAIEAARGQVRPTLEQLKAKYGPNWGLDIDGKKTASAFKAPSWDEIAAGYSGDPSLIARLVPPKHGEN